MKQHIRVDSLTVEDNTRLKVLFSVSKDIQRYFRSNQFIVEYNRDISETPREILAVTATGFLITIAWINNADLYIESLDETFYNSISELKQLFMNRYPNYGYETEIHTKTVHTNSQEKGAGLLFSGGVDAFYSYIENREKNPALFSLIGFEIPYSRKDFHETLYLARKKNLDLNITYIKTNIRETINEPLLNSLYSSIFGGITFFEAFNIGIYLISICAPLAYTYEHLIVASSYTSSLDILYGTDPKIDPKVRYAGIKVTHHGYEVPRSEKVKKIAQYIKQNKPIQLRVCNYAPIYSDKLNCSKCEKCSRTMVQLLINNIDPNMCGFEYTPEKLESIRKKLSCGAFFTHRDKKWFWKDVQNSIPDDPPDREGLIQFLDWLSETNLDDIQIKEKSKLKEFFIPFYMRLPKKIRFWIRKKYNKIKIG